MCGSHKRQLNNFCSGCADQTVFFLESINCRLRLEVDFEVDLVMMSA